MSHTQFLNTSIKKLIHKSHKVVNPFNNNGMKGRCSTCQSGFRVMFSYYHLIHDRPVPVWHQSPTELICLFLRKHYNNLYWKFFAGNSLEVQWLRLCSHCWGPTVQPQLRELRYHKQLSRPKQQRNSAAANLHVKLFVLKSRDNTTNWSVKRYEEFANYGCLDKG